MGFQWGPWFPEWLRNLIWKGGVGGGGRGISWPYVLKLFWVFSLILVTVKACPLYFYTFRKTKALHKLWKILLFYGKYFYGNYLFYQKSSFWRNYHFRTFLILSVSPVDQCRIYNEKQTESKSKGFWHRHVFKREV